ncbi:HAMP domain-containing sensor histidine kinase [Paucibacter sp. AS339]|uniref:HAMP domain-containing sensor histidine kinase n=1 Tax=Paucibacter hankyongi TaxID=3133434 RepID=UPI0030A05215
MSPSDQYVQDPKTPWLSRLARVAQRHPRQALRLYETLESQARQAGRLDLAFDALYAHFNLLEHRGRGAQLRGALGLAQQQATQAGLHEQSARLLEALGRIAYQLGDYLEAAEKWSRAVDLSVLAGDTRVGVAARIGLGQIHYALGAWDNGRRFHRDAALLLENLDDSYLEAKLAINLGVGNFENAQIEEAEQQFQKGMAAAQRGGHREFVAEAHWQLARAAKERGQMDTASFECRLALALAAQLNHAWLESVASQTLTEIAWAQGDQGQALLSAKFSLEQAQRIQSRTQESQAHLQLAHLLQSQGNLNEALQHLWQHLTLLTETQQLGLPERLSKLAHYDLSRKPPEVMLLDLSNQQWPLNSRDDLLAATLELGNKVREILSLDAVQFWWADEQPDRFQLQHGIAGVSASSFAALTEASPNAAEPCAELSSAHQAGYLRLLTQQREPLVLGDMSLHPCAEELQTIAAGKPALSRIEIPLFVQQQLRAVLWLVQTQQTRAWSKLDQFHAAYLAKIYERLLLGLDLAQSQQTQALMEQEKADALGRLVAGVAHEVNTPIGVAVTAASSLAEVAQRLAQLLLSEKVSRNELQQLSTRLSAGVPLVERNLERAATLIGNFKKVAVDQASEAVIEFRLAEYVHSVLSVLSPAIRKAAVNISVEIDPDIELRMASGLLTQVLSNLIMNCISHAFENRQGGLITITARLEARQIVLDVADDGVGASAAVRARMFEPFFTTKRGKGGSGLGMYIVQNLMQRLNGSIELPATERGLCVRLRLPLDSKA